MPELAICFCTNTNSMHQYVSNLFYFGITLHVSDVLSVHHQEFKTLHTATGICCLLASKQRAVSVSHMPVAVCVVLNS